MDLWESDCRSYWHAVFSDIGFLRFLFSYWGDWLDLPSPQAGDSCSVYHTGGMDSGLLKIQNREIFLLVYLVLWHPFLKWIHFIPELSFIYLLIFGNLLVFGIPFLTLFYRNILVSFEFTRHFLKDFSKKYISYTPKCMHICGIFFFNKGEMYALRNFDQFIHFCVYAEIQ